MHIHLLKWDFDSFRIKLFLHAFEKIELHRPEVGVLHHARVVMEIAEAACSLMRAKGAGSFRINGCESQISAMIACALRKNRKSA